MTRGQGFPAQKCSNLRENAHSKIDCQNSGPAAKIITLEFLGKRDMCFFSKNSNVTIVAPGSPFLV